MFLVERNEIPNNSISAVEIATTKTSKKSVDKGLTLETITHKLEKKRTDDAAKGSMQFDEKRSKKQVV